MELLDKPTEYRQLILTWEERNHKIVMEEVCSSLGVKVDEFLEGQTEHMKN